MALMPPKIGKNTGDVNGDITGGSPRGVRLSYRPMLSDILRRIEQRLAATKQTADAASKKAGVPDAVRNLRRAVQSGDERKGVSTRTLELLAPVLQTSPGWLFTGVGPEGDFLVPIIGRVGADPEGRVLMATGQGGLGLAPAPPGATSNVVALRVVGHSMRGFADDGSLIFFENQATPPTAEMLGQTVVIETDGDEVLVKRLLRGSKPNHYDLESIAGPTRRGVALRWAALITAIIPPYQAARIIRPSEGAA